MNPDRLIAGLNPQQTEAVMAKGGPIVCVAGAGTGKTRVLTRRIAYRVATGEIDPNRVLVTTFTQAAAGELSDRLYKVGFREKLTAGTFHSLALSQIGQRAEEKRKSLPTIMDSQAAFCRKNLPPEFKDHTQQIVSEIGWATSQMLTPETYVSTASSQERSVELGYDQVAELFVLYNQLKARKGVMDLNDVITRALHDIATDEVFRSAIAWRHRHIFVDEFQDINPLQYELLSQWRQGRPDVFVVGDPSQAIYSWNGSDPSIISDFAEFNEGSQVIELTENYRSTPQILTAAKAALPSSLDLQPNHGDGPTVEVEQCDDSKYEASWVAAKASQFARGSSHESVAVLARTQAQLELIRPLVPDEVALLTFHGAKGLEWDSVFVVGLEEGFTPSSFAKTRAQIDEERRLLYVAVTRAAKRLFLSYVDEREFKNNVVRRERSRWLPEIEQSQVRINNARVPDKDRITKIRSSLALDSSRDDLEKLTAWRQRKAKSARVSEQAILSDSLLDRLSNLKPKKNSDLAKIDGAGSSRVQRYADELVELLKA